MKLRSQKGGLEERRNDRREIVNSLSSRYRLFVDVMGKKMSLGRDLCIILSRSILDGTGAAIVAT